MSQTDIRTRHPPDEVARQCPQAHQPQADAELEASIFAHGLIQNLVGVPVARKKGHYRIIAGGRRLDAIHRLIEKGRLPADHEVLVRIFSNAKDGREISLAENSDRLQMSPAEECCAFRDIIEVEKKSAADVAKRFGIEERVVLGRLRLANLAPPIFAALEADEITLDVATTADVAIRLRERLNGDARVVAQANANRRVRKRPQAQAMRCREIGEEVSHHRRSISKLDRLSRDRVRTTDPA